MVSKNFIEKYKLDEEDIELAKEEERYYSEKENEEFFEKAVNNLKTKNKLFSIRTNVEVLDKIKNIANNNGLNYQTFINMILYQVANGKINLILK